MHTHTLTGLTIALATCALVLHRRTTRAERQRAAAHAAGYRQGLQHAALGLLNPTISTRIDEGDHQ